MCTVQVLITADVMRNLRRSVMLRAERENICRRLFSEHDDPFVDEPPYDPQPELRRLQTEINAQSARKWNFDFLQERPLPGRFQWEPVNGPAGHPAGRTGEPAVAEVRTEKPVVNEVRTEPEESKTGSTTCKQSKITDFLHSRKRRNSTSVASPKLKKMRPAHSTNCNISEDTTAPSVSST